MLRPPALPALSALAVAALASTARAVAALAVAALACLAVAPAGAALAEQCAWPPPGGSLVHPESRQVEMAPIVADLDGDGSPEIVIVTFTDAFDDGPGFDGILRILRGSDCAELATSVDPGCVTCFGDTACSSLDQSGEAGVLCPGCGVAVADLDGDGFLEIVAISEGLEADTADRRIVIFDHQGQFLRCGQVSPESVGAIAAPAIADLDGDGSPEIIARTSVWASSGALLWARPAAGIGQSHVADLDGDGLMEILAGETTYRSDGSVLWTRPDLELASSAVADLDLDCRPEVIVSARNAQQVHVLDAVTGQTRAQAPLPEGDCPPRRDGQGGPPTLGDVDGDCVPEIGIAGCRRYSLFRWEPGPPEQLVLSWELPIDDASSRFTGSTMFDLEGDGTAEILSNDHHWFRIIDAVTGVVEQQFENSTFTLVELPVVADADGDGRAEVVLAANDYMLGAHAGVRVLHDDAVPWVFAPPLFNQHSFHVTNILPDGRVPSREEPSWARYNTFRVQGPPLRSDEGPVIHGVPDDAEAGCGEAPPPGSPWATGGCGESPELLLVETAEGPPGCGTLRREWTATDRCGRMAMDVQVIAFTDDEAPELVGVPEDASLPCDAPMPPADVAATDACDPAPLLTMIESETGDSCLRTVSRTWTATDACGHETDATWTVTFTDDEPPELLGVPEDVTVTCDAVPPPAEPLAIDGCSAVSLAFEEERIDGACPDAYVLRRTWTATDACGLVASQEQVITVVDDAPPLLLGVPEDVVVECDEVPAPAAVTVEGGCDPAPVLAFEELRIDGRCPSEHDLVRTWSARDRCGNVTTATQLVRVVDTTPPTITGMETACLWSPNHWTACFSTSDFHPVVEDACGGEITWRFEGCASDQPEDALGDGAFAPDCFLDDEGRICVRSERQGMIPEGRRYGIAAVAVDACGNESAPALIADILVPRDQREHPGCLKIQDVGEKGHGRPSPR